MTVSTYGLADVDGELCVTCETSNWNKPEWYKCHWPTGVRTARFCQYHECQPADLASWLVTGGRPGEFNLRRTAGRFEQTYYVELPQGGRTESILTTTRPYAPPRAKECEYRDGKWHKYTKANGWQCV